MIIVDFDVVCSRSNSEDLNISVQTSRSLSMEDFKWHFVRNLKNWFRNRNQTHLLIVCAMPVHLT